jgi:hypothetical protein
MIRAGSGLTKGLLVDFLPGARPTRVILLLVDKAVYEATGKPDGYLP